MLGGTKGKTRETLKAEYELEGYDLDIRLLEIHKDTLPANVYQGKLLDIEFKYLKISLGEYQRGLANLIQDEKKKKIALLELDYKENKISRFNYEKESATINDEPWVAVVKLEFGTEKAEEGSFELDWNDKFIEMLEDAGYIAMKPDQTVNLWFSEVCRAVALESYDGVGTFTEDSEYALNSQEGEIVPKGKRNVK